ncbi:DUF4347 domain-containing protein [Phormidium sp. LEGE 05292]|uniref:DUF4347 domain-containing protein n=1 Tax=[Phormidium] sp. LEGE 05292 TaxID=767427 RepID=UPI001880D137|nr:DUF4347 domain-containing protein [Phormidium sp. LEGE 05292]MBE9225656.1 DUF4347 domain-containing protein [Phormidium sp. LEGE 05292]
METISSIETGATPQFTSSRQEAKLVPVHHPFLNPIPALVVIDPGLPDYQTLAAGVLPGSQILILNSYQDGVEQITTTLNHLPPVQTLHIVSHGKPGCLYLGNSQLNLDTLAHYAPAVQNWFARPESQLFLYGCHVAAGDAGSEFIDRLQQLTGVAIAASTTPIGASFLGGNWQLDVTTRDMEVGLCFQNEIIQTYAAIFAPGSLDPSFGSGGKVITSGGFVSTYGITLQPDGKILSTGSGLSPGSNLFSLTRYNIDGSLDTTFGNSGKVTTDIYSGTAPDRDRGQVVLVQPDGKIVVAGPTTIKLPAAYTYLDSFALVRYNSDGSLDTSFGDNGKALFRPGYLGAELGKAVLQPDGKIILVEDATSSSGISPFVLQRFNSNGSFDTTFGSLPTYPDYMVGSSLTISVNNINSARDAVLQPDGKLVVLGFGTNLLTGGPDTSRSLTLLRFKNGSFDYTFGTLGITRSLFQILPNDFSFSLYSQAKFALTADGKIVVAADGTSSQGATSILLRYNSDGSLDPDFGIGGRITTSAITTVAGVAIDSNGRISVAGQANGDFVLMRYSSTGSLDTSFGNNGKVTTDFGTTTDNPLQLVTQPDGKIVLTGTANGNFVMARYEGGGSINTVNYAPTDINFANRTFIPENVLVTPIQNAYSVALKLSATDPDTTDLHTYTLVAGAGDSDNAVFKIDGDLLVPLQTFDFETKSSYSVRVRANDRKGGFFDKALTVAVYDLPDTTAINSAPIDLSLSSANVAENLAVNTIVGTFSSIDPDVGDTFTYSLVTGTGSTDNAAFQIAGNTLQTAQSFNFESKSAYSIRIRTDDGKGGIFEKPFTIGIQDLNEAPFITAAIANQTTTTGTAFSYIVPTTTFSDPDAGDAITLSATLSDGSALPTWLSFDPTTRAFSGTPTSTNLGTVNLLLRATDRGGLSTTTGFSLTVNSVTSGTNATTGTAGDDYLVGSSSADTIQGLAGNDTIDGGLGADSLIGGSGNDIYIVDNISDVIVENLNEGIDTVQSSVTYTLGNNVENLSLTGTGTINGTGNNLDNAIAGNSAKNILTGGVGNDSLNGGAGNDTLNGGDGNDILDGGTGADRLVGNAGNDTYIVDNTGDTVVEASNSGIDLVQSSISWTLSSNVENLTLTGTAAIKGTGNNLNNAIVGNLANNILTGGAGNDTLTGGAGSDRFVYNSFDNRTDIITDFNTSQDILDLSTLFDSLDYAGSNPVTDGFLRFAQSGANTLVQIDRDGIDGGAGFSTLVTLNNVNANNLVVGTNVL